MNDLNNLSSLLLLIIFSLQNIFWIAGIFVCQYLDKKSRSEISDQRLNTNQSHNELQNKVVLNPDRQTVLKIDQEDSRDQNSVGSISKIKPTKKFQVERKNIFQENIEIQEQIRKEQPTNHNTTQNFAYNSPKANQLNVVQEASQESSPVKKKQLQQDGNLKYLLNYIKKEQSLDLEQDSKHQKPENRQTMIRFQQLDQNQDTLSQNLSVFKGKSPNNKYDPLIRKDSINTPPNQKRSEIKDLTDTKKLRKAERSQTLQIQRTDRGKKTTMVMPNGQVIETFQVKIDPNRKKTKRNSQKNKKQPKEESEIDEFFQVEDNARKQNDLKKSPNEKNQNQNQNENFSKQIILTEPPTSIKQARKQQKKIRQYDDNRIKQLTCTVIKTNYYFQQNSNCILGIFFKYNPFISRFLKLTQIHIRLTLTILIMSIIIKNV